MIKKIKIKKAFYLFPLVLLFIETPIILSEIVINDAPSNKILYYPSNSGAISFERNSFTASNLKFYHISDDSYLMISNFYYVYYTWKTIGFNCNPNSNLTINQLKNNKLIFTVNAPTSTTSTTKIYVGNLGQPKKITGAESSYFSSGILTVIVKHNSPQEVIVIWEGFKIKNVIFPALNMLGTIVFVMSATLVMQALNGDIEPDSIIDIFKISLISGIAILILSVIIQ